MATLSEVRSFALMVRQNFEIFGCEAGIQEQFLQKVRAIGEAITTELGIPLEQGSTLPNETALPPKTERLFQQLQLWWENNSA